MTDDRELLEAAARAAGIELAQEGFKPRLALHDDDPVYGPWNPLTDDADAFRLAIDLNISFRNMGHVMTACCAAGQFNEYADGDPYAATRRAITRAAAEIGRKMEMGHG